MYTLTARVGRLRPILLMVVALFAGACADDRSITSPRPDSPATEFSVGTETTLETTDGTVVTITPSRTGSIRHKSGFVELSANVSCSKAGVLIHLVAYLDQRQRKTGDTVSGYGEIDVACTIASVPSFIPVVMGSGDPLPERGKADVLFRVHTGGVAAPEVMRSIRLIDDFLN